MTASHFQQLLQGHNASGLRDALLRQHIASGRFVSLRGRRLLDGLLHALLPLHQQGIQLLTPGVVREHLNLHRAVDLAARPELGDYAGLPLFDYLTSLEGFSPVAAENRKLPARVHCQHLRAVREVLRVISHWTEPRASGLDRLS